MNRCVVGFATPVKRLEFSDDPRAGSMDCLRVLSHVVLVGRPHGRKQEAATDGEAAATTQGLLGLRVRNAAVGTHLRQGRDLDRASLVERGAAGPRGLREGASRTARGVAVA